MTSAGSAPEYWGARAAEYDSLIRRTIPRYDEIVAMLLDALPARCGRILELGCGTGNLSLRLAERFPDAAITLVDAAPEMLQLAGTRLQAAHPANARRITLMPARFEELALERGGFDAVVASFSLHHLPVLAPLYRQVREWLDAGGVLGNADAFAGPTPRLHEWYMRRWMSYWHAPGKLNDEEIRSMDAHVRAHDHYFDVAAHFRWLETAGFATWDCVWRDGLLGVLVAENG